MHPSGGFGIADEGRYLQWGPGRIDGSTACQRSGVSPFLGLAFCEAVQAGSHAGFLSWLSWQVPGFL